VGLAVLGLVVAVVAALLVGGSGSGESTAQSTAPPSATASPGGPTFPPGTVRIVDRASGISYPFLGDGWYEWALGSQEEVSSIAGQFFTTQEVTPDQTRFIAQCTSGPLVEGYGWAGPSTLAATVTTLADSVRANYYPGPNERRLLRDEARTVDGHDAHLIEFLGRARLRRDRRARGPAAHRHRPAGTRAALHLDPQHPRRAVRRHRPRPRGRRRPVVATSL
jgi:hypothetical protein